MDELGTSRFWALSLKLADSEVFVDNKFDNTVVSLADAASFSELSKCNKNGMIDYQELDIV